MDATFWLRDITYNILKQLDRPHLARVASVCKQWREIIYQTESFWRELKICKVDRNHTSSYMIMRLEVCPYIIAHNKVITIYTRRYLHYTPNCLNLVFVGNTNDLPRGPPQLYTLPTIPVSSRFCTDYPSHKSLRIRIKVNDFRHIDRTAEEWYAWIEELSKYADVTLYVTPNWHDRLTSGEWVPKGTKIIHYGCSWNRQEVMEVLKCGYRFTWSQRLTGCNMNPATAQDAVSTDRTVNFILEQLFSSIGDQRNELGEIDLSLVRIELSKFTPLRRIEAGFGNYQNKKSRNEPIDHTDSELYSVDCAMRSFSDDFTHDAVRYMTRLLCSLKRLNLQHDNHSRYQQKEAEDHWFGLGDISDFYLHPKLVSLQPKRVMGDLELASGGYTEDQREMLETEDRLRSLFVTDRNSDVLNDMYVGLMDAHTISIDHSPLDDAEMCLARLLHMYKKDKPASEGSAIVDHETFVSEWKKASYDLLEDLPKGNIFVAGGSILGILTGQISTPDYAESDIDIFIYNTDVAGDLQRLSHTLKLSTKKIRMRHSKREEEGGLIVVKSKHSLTICCGFPYRNIQIILRIYKSPAEILLGFDIDCCAVGYDLERVWVTPRAARAIRKKYNLVNVTRRSTSYEYRLFKYAKRGYSVMVSDLDMSRVDTNLYSKKFNECQGLARLLLYNARPSPPLGHGLIHSVQLGLSKLVLPENMGWTDTHDYAGFVLPWGPRWTFSSLSSLIYRFNLSIGKKSPANDVHYIRVAQLRNFSDGSMHWNEHYELEKVMEEMSWLTENPMRQGEQMMTGSFHPLSSQDWMKGVYAEEERGEEKKTRREEKEEVLELEADKVAQLMSMGFDDGELIMIVLRECKGSLEDAAIRLAEMN
ncbi:ankyrin repeat-containing protein [Planoprotostelium fungivorum]|uniref:Ankyrin repeat-containing protein n=1 Tax=Planoprotostelium fungivorum TaxID=1890364 RepID=A0A2P6NRS9_9EUKA|nr:ankyrin repeat-containing protein [Planoprotostelium fungivorum]